MNLQRKIELVKIRVGLGWVGLGKIKLIEIWTEEND